MLRDLLSGFLLPPASFRITSSPASNGGYDSQATNSLFLLVGQIEQTNWVNGRGGGVQTPFWAEGRRTLELNGTTNTLPGKVLELSFL